MRRVLSLFLLIPSISWGEVPQGAPNVPEFAPAFAGQTRAPEMAAIDGLDVTIFAQGLAHPWGIAALPGGGFLVTERDGRLRHVGADGAVSAAILGVPEVVARGQGGLLDVALAPDFGSSRAIYLSYAKPVGLGRSVTAVARGQLSHDMTELGDIRDVYFQNRPSRNAAHFGSRVVFGGGHMFITTGERFSPANRLLAQDKGVDYGKVLRLSPEGALPADNPFGNAVWSLGHRNVQGAAFDAAGQLWAIEHGPKGGDELNKITRGANYGWPVISYGENYSGTPVGRGLTQAPGMEQPVYYWDPVIAPSGMVFYDGAMFPEWRGDLLIASLRPGGLVRLRLRDGRVVGEQRMLTGTRVRDVEVAPDGSILVLVDADDGGILRLSLK
ncbi:PQQ-dependent sugar dehydrogenase [Actibacterium sp. XHP0104]|uniref:PQQ-dependent sugar dehydrogenase n=1 Tax=Actibacterium sp. XHP0104 TaxID=2984335 RepID=UPI0021E836C5|nr:PQQ-dependent sugar dehydrogenase [Actibacterium sp. XHP0104]MCV2882027.1 PQQ-dependent sugar dehydrogenase [Actibacterium sp. XHP0104]